MDNVIVQAAKELRDRRLARSSFEDFRGYINADNKNFKTGWWQSAICQGLQNFINDTRAGDRPKLIIQAPPQHGKSEMIVDFIAWSMGLDPDLRAIYASFSQRLGIRANLRLQRLFSSQAYKLLFPELTINDKNTVSVSNQTLRNREIIGVIGRAGYFRNTTVGGSVTGESLDLGIIDDPVKGRAEASSPVIRDSTWDWFLDDFYTRFSADASMIVIGTRWHSDDAIGRMVDNFGGNVNVISYPAIAVRDEKYRKEGEALFPEHKPVEFLLERKGLLSDASWKSLYQQCPVDLTGKNIIRSDQLVILDDIPTLSSVFITADSAIKASMENDGSAYIVWGVMTPQNYADQKNIRLIILDWDIFQVEASMLELKYEPLIRACRAQSPVFHSFRLEDKGSGIELNQRLRKKYGALIQPLDSRYWGHLSKSDRVLIAASDGFFERGQVFISRQAAEKTVPFHGRKINHLFSQLDKFLIGEENREDDLVDCLTYGAIVGFNLQEKK